MSLEVYVAEVIAGQRENKPLALFLQAMSWGYRMAVSLRHFAYERSWIKKIEVPVPVISVGNIVAGGTGKTPLVMMLAQELLQRGQCAILSRGYRSRIERSGEILHLSKEALPRLSAAECGDEPYFLASHLPEAMVFVGKKRSRSAQLACEAGAAYILLDDGMQHRRLARDLELVLVDARDPFGRGYFLPRGFLRDPPKRLAIADLIIATHMEDAQDYRRFQEKIAPYTAAPIVGMRLTPEEDQDLREKRVGLFCAIGKPDRFIETVCSLGGTVVETFIAKDHQQFRRRDLEAFAKRCQSKRAELLVCTEKDWVKLPAGIKPSLPITPIKVRMEIIAGQEHWRAFLEKAKKGKL